MKGRSIGPEEQVKTAWRRERSVEVEAELGRREERELRKSGSIDSQAPILAWQVHLSCLPKSTISMYFTSVSSSYPSLSVVASDMGF
jgi:hypothetical protein